MDHSPTPADAESDPRFRVAPMNRLQVERHTSASVYTLEPARPYTDQLKMLGKAEKCS